MSSSTVTAVNDFSYSVGEGKLIGILGPNGAGKTTLLRMIAGLIKPDSGSITLFNHVSMEETPELYHQSIGFLTNELKYDGFLTANQLFYFYSQLYGLDSEQAEQQRKDLFEKFG